jgi:hypothetical protein
MARVRVSTTVDAHTLEAARRLFPGSDSTLMDRALALLVRHLEAERERAILSARPYEDDPALTWEAPSGPDLPYDGDIPADVLELARQRRARSV